MSQSVLGLKFRLKESNWISNVCFKEVVTLWRLVRCTAGSSRNKRVTPEEVKSKESFILSVLEPSSQEKSEPASRVSRHVWTVFVFEAEVFVSAPSLFPTASFELTSCCNLFLLRFRLQLRSVSAEQLIKQHRDTTLTNLRTSSSLHQFTKPVACKSPVHPVLSD